MGSEVEIETGCCRERWTRAQFGLHQLLPIGVFVGHLDPLFKAGTETLPELERFLVKPP
jgi:hypothetical protein